MSQITRANLGTGAAPVETLTGNAGGAVSPTAGGTINVVGGDTAYVDGNPGSNTLTISSGIPGSGQTVGFTTDDLYTRAFIINSGATLIAEVVAVNSAGTLVSGGSVIGVAKYDTTSGNTTVVFNGGDFGGDQVGVPAPNEPAIEWVAAGNNVILRATGVDTVTYDWNAIIRVIEQP